MAPRKAAMEKKESGVVVVQGKKGRTKATTPTKDMLTSLSSLERFLAQLEGNRTMHEEEEEEEGEDLIWKRQYEELYALKETEGQRIYTEAAATLEKEEKALKEWKSSREKKYVQQVKELKKAIQELEKENKTLKSKEKQGADQNNLRLLEEENKACKKLIAELESKSAKVHSKSPDTKAALRASAKALEISSSNIRLTGANTMLAMHEVLTGIHLNTAPPLEDSDEASKYTDLICTVGPPIITKRLVFQLAIPNDPDEEIDYLPLPDSTTMTEIPKHLSHLLEEISFKREQLPKFIKGLQTLIGLNSDQ